MNRFLVGALWSAFFFALFAFVGLMPLTTTNIFSFCFVVFFSGIMAAAFSDVLILVTAFISNLLGLILSFFIIGIFNWSFFTDEIALSSINQAPTYKVIKKSPEEAQIVNLQMAESLANKAIGVKQNGIPISTQFELDSDNASMQKVKGELYWVFPLQHHTSMKALQAPTVPAFVMVSATKKIAPIVINKSYSLSSSGWLSDNISRKAWYITGLGNFHKHFEVDDKLNPYWIVTKKKYNFSLTGPIVVSAYVLDNNGNLISSGSLSSVMKNNPWIDELISVNVAKDWIDDLGTLRGKWLNQSAFGSGANVTKASEKPEPAFYNGRKYWITSMTSVSSSDHSSTGLMMVDAITSTLYEVEVLGMDESGALGAADSGLGAESSRWEAVNAQPIVIGKDWYWGVSIAAKSTGLFERAAVVKMNDASVVFYGNSIVEAASKVGSSNKDAVANNKTKSIKERVAELKNKINDIQKEIDSIYSELN